MNLQDKIEKLRVFQKKSRKVQAETRQKLMNGAISIQEVEQFDQLITAVLHESDGKWVIKDLKAGAICEHSERSARYHAKALGQGLIPVQRVCGQISHIKVNQ